MATESLEHRSSSYDGGLVHPSAYVDKGATVGEGTRIWHFSHVQPGATIGRNCSIGQNVNIGNNVRIGNNVKIQNNVSVYEGVELEDYVFCGPSCVFTNVRDPRSKYPQRGSKYYVNTLVREGATIGANATILCGHTIGRHAFIAAGAVVNGDVPDYAMMAGVPARQKGWRCECGAGLNGKTTINCLRCGRRYKLVRGVLAVDAKTATAPTSKRASAKPKRQTATRDRRGTRRGRAGS